MEKIWEVMRNNNITAYTHIQQKDWPYDAQYKRQFKIKHTRHTEYHPQGGRSICTSDKTVDLYPHEIKNLIGNK